MMNIKYIAMLSALFLVAHVPAAELAHQFNSPAFSGIGYSSHILTIKQLEDQQKDKNKALADALKAQADAAVANTPQAIFLANLQSRIYSQLAKQLTDSMFGSGATCTSTIQCGIIPNLGGNEVTWRLGDPSYVNPKTGLNDEKNMVVITIKPMDCVSLSCTTNMLVPSGTFYF